MNTGPCIKRRAPGRFVRFNLARLEYQRRNLGQALQLLQKAEYKDLMLNLAAKMLQFKIFLRITGIRLLDLTCRPFGPLSAGKKVMGYHRENYLNTVYFTQKLLETNLFDKNERAALRGEIEATKAVAEKEWLLAVMADK